MQPRTSRALAYERKDFRVLIDSRSEKIYLSTGSFEKTNSFTRSEPHSVGSQARLADAITTFFVFFESC
jgi:hypothetical protein